ncbi:cell wall metabolism sensor histidine kinase WalK [Aciduricibacillus chroicocephali]|uniref:histidine kinase n=1 Tax=Aciduricibacillus chroicocephali TaxID=3054939 RepID=A0ABY9KVF1_9BACI|nr:cell wall metabolism sensor histidine kinase WalK [Bacillaceae bacterium 44XB]
MNKVGFFKSIQLKFIIIYILLLLVAIQVIGSYFVRQLETELIDNFKTSINDRVKLLTYNLEQAFKKERPEDGGLTLEQDMQNIVDEIKPESITKLLVINNQSRVLATNDYQNMDVIGKKTTEDMVQKVLLFGTPSEERVLQAGTDHRLYVKAAPIRYDDGTTAGVIYLEASLEGVYNQLENINEIFFKGSILAIIVSAFIGILVARTITKPILEMRRQAQIMATGDFTQKVNVYGSDEIGQLAETFNDLNDKLKHSYQTIEEEERKLSSVLANMSDGVIAADKTGAVTLMNEAAGKLLGRRPDTAIGEFLLDVLQLEEKIVDVDELQEGGSTIIDFSEDDDISLIRANFSTVSDDEDDITGFITVISDVTEQEKDERERREFVSNVSHELRTPLTTMRSYLEALLDGAWEDKKIAPNFLNVAQTETDRMIRMVNDLLQLSRMDNKEHALKKVRVDFITFMNQVIDRFEMNLDEESNITLERQLPEGPFFVWIDRDKMTQVLDNIISNAIKYSPGGGIVGFKAAKLRQQLMVSISDQGIGIDYDKTDKIFERFYRTDKARTRKLGGTGLGLAISKEIVEAHYGRIWAESELGKGTTIHFALPLMNAKRRDK